MPLSELFHDNYNCCLSKVSLDGSRTGNFSKEMKNPCWYDDNKVLRCLPYFYLVGVSKSGTTDLAFRLSNYPHISLPRKEKHWFDLLRFASSTHSIDNYIHMFDEASKEIKKQSVEMVTGDCTPSYMFESIYWKCYQGNEGLTEPLYTIPNAIKSLTPNAKILIIMRDPVTRLLSSFLSWTGRRIRNDSTYMRPSASGFHQICAEAIKLYQECFKTHSVRACAYDGFLYGKAQLRLQESMYSVFVKDWLNVFPRENILFIKFDDYITNMTDVLKEVYDFLDLGEIPDEEIVEISKKKAKNVGRNYRHIPEMLNKTKIMLQQFYSPFVADLKKLIGDNFDWGY